MGSLDLRLKGAIKRLLEEGCSELPKALEAELSLLGCYRDGERLCCPKQEDVALWAVLNNFLSEYEAAKYLNWKAFESYVARALDEAGFDVVKNLRVKVGGRRFEFDVVGYDGRRVVVVECKRWNRASPSALRKVAEEHSWKVWAAKEALSEFGKVALPVVVTLKGRPVREGVPVVPIKYFKGFLSEIDVAFCESYVVKLSK